MGAAIVQSWGLYEAMLYSHWLIYIFGPILLFKYGHPIAGGIVMLLSIWMPLAGQAWFTDSDAPGLGFLFILEAPLALMVFVAGLIIGLVRLFRRLRAVSE